MVYKSIIGAMCICLVVVSFNASAALIDRGGGLLYDDVLDITWLQDANYAKTSGYDSDGSLSRTGSVTWIEQLSYGGYNDWRLPTKLEDELPFHFGWWVSGGNIDPSPTSGPHTELSYMYYVNLGLNGYLDTGGVWATSFGIHGDSTFGGQNNIGLIQNLQGGEYWMGFSMADVSNHYDTQPFTLNTNTGNHYVRSHDSHFVWAVHDGDIGAVPIPAAVWLFGSGLIGLVGVARRKANA